MSGLIGNWWHRDDAATAVEYALIAALIALAVVGTVAALGTSVSGLYQTAYDAFP